MTTDKERVIAMAVGLGVGCAAGIVQALGAGMTPHQIAHMLDDLANNRGAMRAIASTVIEDASSGGPEPKMYKALIEALCAEIKVR